MKVVEYPIGARVRYAALSYAAAGCVLSMAVVGGLLGRSLSAPVRVVAPEPAGGITTVGSVALMSPPEPAPREEAVPPSPQPAAEPRAPAEEPPVLIPAPLAMAAKPLPRPHESVPPARPATRAVVPANVQPPSAATVSITDQGFMPDRLTIRLGGSVDWINHGSSVHTATAVGPVRPFDTGGLAAQQHASASFTTPGTYAYSSAPDCLNGQHSSRFNCGATFTVTVVAS
ncbi:MAG TPA: hypothetical protein VF157_03655 [Chloroflexota bacterium]